MDLAGDLNSCCQTTVLEPEDCILGGDGLWRPVTGADILAELSPWGLDQHRTHQDPGLEACAFLAGTADLDDAKYRDCLEQLTVADQRGYCMDLAAGEVCPAARPSYLDACEQINMGLIPPPA